MKHKQYLVHFYYFNRQIACNIESNDDDIITNIRSGFWIDNNLQIADRKSSDRCYWIPPCRLIAIESLR